MVSLLASIHDRMAELDRPDLSRISGLPFGSDLLSRLPVLEQNPAPPPNTILGTNAGETLDGTSSDDVIDALGGSDTVSGKAGDDVIVTSGDGFDRLYGDEGNDELRGGDAGNLLHGGSGNDHAYGGAGGDKLNGDSGDDVLEGGAGVDKVSGGFGQDTVIGGAGTDELVGGFGADAFRFTQLDGSVDVVSDFNFVPDVGEGLDQGDRFELNLGAFAALGDGAGNTLSESEFALGTKATSAGQHILYDQAAGALFYDVDGSGTAKAVQFASVAGRVELHASDFLLIA
ncbi:hypothetical protein KBI52_13890 [Microvirga sp. HBU67558]|uniref:calcium-binding protein n=1 Tax=Microvirga TaxID=186650 RepID=UPI001B37B7AC|nr:MULTISPECIES: calcium-binding protein [unclassified Microvirga]MBQ0821292.1 hypothetical protein [Microvirga sp. HBU67558]